MQESEYRSARFRVQCAAQALRRLVSEKASQSEVDQTHESLLIAKDRLEKLILSATPDERRKVSVSLAEEYVGGYAAPPRQANAEQPTESVDFRAQTLAAAGA